MDRDLAGSTVALAIDWCAPLNAGEERHGRAGDPPRAEDPAGAGRQGDAHPLDHGRPGLRRRLGLDHRRHPAQHRGHGPGGDPRAAQGPPAQPGARLRERRRVPEVLVPRRRGPARTRSSWSSRARSPTSRSRTRATGRRSAPTRRPASRSPPATGSTAWRPRRGPWSRPAPAPPTAASTRWRATRPAAWAWPTTSAGTGDRRPGMPIVCVPGCPVQPDNFMETLLYLLYQAAGLAPMIPLDEQLRPTWLFGQTVHEGCDRGRLLRAGRLRPRVRLAQVPRQARLLGAGGAVQRRQARLDGRHRRLPQRRRHLHRLHHARLPRQVHAVHGRAARAASSRRRPSSMYGRMIRKLRSFTNTHRSTRSRSGGTAAPS